MAVETNEIPQRLTTQSNWLTRKQVTTLLRQILTHVVLLPAALVFLLPFLWVLSTSLKTDAQLYAYPPVWIPNPLKWSNYSETVVYIPFFLYLRNTLIIAVTSTIGATVHVRWWPTVCLELTGLGDSSSWF